MADPLVTVVIPTFNGEDYLDELLVALSTQQLDGKFDVLVIDSGSTDSTLEILRGRDDIRLIEIPNSEFGHGRTRQFAAEQATGRFLVYLTQDAVPANEQWLAELIAPFGISDDIVLVTGRQIPRTRAFPLQKYEIVGAFDALGPRFATTVFSSVSTATQADRDRAAFHSDVNAAVRRDVVLGAIPFRDVRYAEDQFLARDVLAAGLLKAYAGRSAVVHSNDLTRAEYGKRIFDETVGLRRIDIDPGAISRPAQYARTVRGSLGDSIRIVRDRDYRLSQKLRWLFVNPLYQARKWRSYRIAMRADLANSQDSKHSLEFERGKGVSGSRRP